MSTLEFTKQPSVLKAYTRMLRTRPGLKQGESLPELSATLADFLPVYGDVRAYEEVCGLPHTDGSEAQRLPLIYPQVLAAPLHMQLLAHPDFPLASAGLIHLRNTITRHRHVPLYARLQVTASLGETREVEIGREFDILTTVHVEGELLWEAVTTILQKSSNKPSKSKDKKRERVPLASSIDAPDRSVVLKVPASQGRRYAAICKDYNPIHIHPLSAKLFGFPRAIAHGMWVLGRSIAEVIEELDEEACFLQVGFKRPVLLPSRVLLTTKRHEDGHLEVAVTTRDGAIPHVQAQLFLITEEQESE